MSSIYIRAPLLNSLTILLFFTNRSLLNNKQGAKKIFFFCSLDLGHYKFSL